MDTTSPLLALDIKYIIRALKRLQMEPQNSIACHQTVVMGLGTRISYSVFYWGISLMNVPKYVRTTDEF